MPEVNIEIGVFTDPRLTLVSFLLRDKMSVKLDLFNCCLFFIFINFIK